MYTLYHGLASIAHKDSRPAGSFAGSTWWTTNRIVIVAVVKTNIASEGILSNGGAATRSNWRGVDIALSRLWLKVKM
jgi:hypothetical protein